MQLDPPPPDLRLPRATRHHDLLRAAADAGRAVDRHEQALALALSDPGAIELPNGAPNALDLAQLQAAGPLYFASELEAAGLLRCAELVAGLFASGTITQPLGPVAQLLHGFWRARRERLDRAEREAIFARVLEAPHFERLMAAVCRALVAQADGGDLREGVMLSTAAQGLGEFLAQRLDAMASIASRDLVDAINAALGFLRDRLLQVAFGVQSLWALVAVAAQQSGGQASAGSVQAHVDRGRAGQAILLWLAANHGHDAIALDPADPADVELMMSAQRWLDAVPRTPATAVAVAAALPIAA